MSTTSLASFCLGCFWHPDVSFAALPGVISTRVGYSGGTKKNPTYHDLGDHTETVEVTYDPKKIPYEKLLEHFWADHDPTYKAPLQYQSIIFTRDAEQQEVAEKSAAEQEKKLGHLATEIRPASEFTPAEEYHQKYLLKNEDVAC